MNLLQRGAPSLYTPIQEGGAQITDKAHKRKNADRNNEIGGHFCLLRQLRLQIAVTYVYAPAALQLIAAAGSAP